MTPNARVPPWLFIASTIPWTLCEQRLVSCFHARRVIWIDLLKSLRGSYNMLICCIRKLYFLIAYLIVSYGNIQEYCQALLFVAAYHRIDYLPLKSDWRYWLLSGLTKTLPSACLTAKPSSNQGIKLEKITIALHEYSRKPQTNVIPSFYSNKKNQVFRSLRASAD